MLLNHRRDFPRRRSITGGGGGGGAASYKIGWLVVLRINVDLAIFQPYLDLEARDNQSLKIQVARPGIEPRSSSSASQELNHSATTAPHRIRKSLKLYIVLQSNALVGIKISIIDICYANTASIPKTLMVSLLYK